MQNDILSIGRYSGLFKCINSPFDKNQRWNPQTPPPQNKKGTVNGSSERNHKSIREKEKASAILKNTSTKSP